MSDHLSPPPPVPPVPSPSLPPVPGPAQASAGLPLQAGPYPANQFGSPAPGPFPGGQFAGAPGAHTGPAAYLGAPIPPRSRAGSHVLGVVMALVLGPLAFMLLVFGTAIWRNSQARALETPWFAFGLLAAAAISLGLVAWWNYRSSAGAATLAVMWVGSGLLALMEPESIGTVTRALGDLFSYQAEMGAASVLYSQVPLLIGVCFAGAAGAASIARRRGRADGRRGGIASRSGGVPVPPRSRVLAHIAASLASACLAIIAWAASATYINDVWMMRSGSNWLALIVAVVALVLIPVLGAWSSLGPAVAGGAWLGALVAIIVLPPWSQDFLAPVATVASWLGGPPFAEAMIIPARDGLAPAIVGVLLGSALGTHFARRDGRAIERSERRLTTT